MNRVTGGGGAHEPDRRRYVAPGVGLLVYGVLSTVWCGLMVLGMLIDDGSGAGTGPMYDAAAQAGERMGEAIAKVGVIVGLVGSLLSALGGLAMVMQGSKALGIAGAIGAMVNLMCCCVPGLGVGIWALVVLMSEPVRDPPERIDVF